MVTSLPTSLRAFLPKRVIARAILGFAILLVLLVAFSHTILPGILRTQLEAGLTDSLQRRTSIGDVDIDPLALTVILHDVRLMEAQGDALFASFDTLALNLSAESLFRWAPVLQEIRLIKPYIHLVRHKDNRYNIDDLLEAFTARPASDGPARFSLNNIQVEQGRIEFDDQPAKAVHAVSELTLGVPFISSLPSQVQIFVEPMLRAKVNGTPLLVKGKLRPFADTRDATVELNADELDLTRFLDYMPLASGVRIPAAKLDMRMTASFRQQENQAPSLILDGTMNLKSVEIADANGKRALQLGSLAFELKDLDAFAGRIDINRVIVNGVATNIERNREGRLAMQEWLASAPEDKSASNPSVAPAVNVAKLEIHNASARFSDAHAARPIHAIVEGLDVELQKIALDPRRKSISIGEIRSDAAALTLRHRLARELADEAGPTQAQADATAEKKESRQKTVSDATRYALTIDKMAINGWTARVEDNTRSQPAVTSLAPIAFTLLDFSTAQSSRAQMELRATVNKSGRLAIKGRVGLEPLQSDLTIDADRVDLLALQPLFNNRTGMMLASSTLSGRGQLILSRSAPDDALQGGFKGGVTFNNVRALHNTGDSEFLRWKSLGVAGMDLAFAPLSLKAEEVTLDDFFARIAIEPDGRFNLQNLLGTPQAEGTAAGSDAASAVPASTVVHNSDARQRPSIRIGKLKLQRGRVRFTDNFIRPNYSARLSELSGVVSGLSSDPASSAEVDIQGEVNDAPLSIAGRINPLRGDLFLDLKATVRGMELAPLSPYSSRYVGYGIEKGKLSFEVAYQVQHQALTAQNRLVLDQLSFGAPNTETASASLPVRLGVALLRDSKGVIDVNLPVAGSLNDPEFSVAGVLFKAFGNLLAKAVTQPFALLGSLFAQGEALSSSLELDPGRSRVPASSEAGLRSLAKALQERPSLQLEITGRADPEHDLPGLKRATLERKLRAQKIKDLQARGIMHESSRVTIEDEEYPGLLARVVEDEKIPRPRNFLGLPRHLSTLEMEKLILDSVSVDENDLLALANRRATSVKNWLQTETSIPAERIFILASKIGDAGTSDSAARRAAHRVDFSLR